MRCKHKQRVRIKCGFYEGHIGYVEKEREMFSYDNDYRVILDDRTITSWIRGTDLEELKDNGH